MGLLTAFRGTLKRFYAFIYVSIIGLIVGFRSESVGVDTERYHSSFYKIANEGYNHRDFAYSAFANILSAIGGGVVLLKTVLAFMVVAPIGYVVYKESKFPPLSYAFFFASGFFAFSMSGMRQAAAVGLIFIAFHLAYETRYRVALSLILFSIGLHASALVMLLAVPLIFMNTSVTLVFLMVSWVFSIIFLFQPSLSYQFMDLFYWLVPARFEVYLAEGEGASLGLSSLFDQFLFLASAFSFYYIKDKYARISIILFCFGVVFGNIFSVVDHVSRLSHYFIVFGVISLPSIVAVVGNARVRRTILVILYALLAVQFVFRVVVDPYQIVPYGIYY